MQKAIEYLNSEPFYNSLNEKNRRFLYAIAKNYPLSKMDIHNLLTICIDLEMWNETSLEAIWPGTFYDTVKNKQIKKTALSRVQSIYKEIKEKKKKYPGNIKREITVPRPKIEILHDTSTILGRCPVASEKTRCCNLQTLDAVINCGFGCTYCTIQPFYNDSKVLFHKELGKKLNDLHLNPEEIYHIGTGQSSDSLMWDNSHGVLDDLFSFASEHPNVILELKTKAALASYLKHREIPKNIITTWTINTPKIISNEELGTAPLKARISGASEIIKQKRLTGFHFHPIVYYEGWEEDYSECVSSLVDSIDPEFVAMVSLGTLTFIKPVISQIRKRKLHTKILQMPLEESAGKLSYPREIKIELFSKLYNAFSPWHQKVFFYLCMEPEEIWLPVFGKEYQSNSLFENDMKHAYMKKIEFLG